VLLVLSFVGCSGGNYKKAMKLYEDGSFEEAQQIFEELGDYEDSAKMIEECKYGIAANMLEEAYDKYCKTEWAEIADDGSYLSIDTNPDNLEDELEVDAFYALEDVNAELGFPSSLYKKMGETRSVDGRLSEANDNFTVSWTYHPDNGMEAIYEVEIDS
jgi:hypothetical protein